MEKESREFRTRILQSIIYVYEVYYDYCEVQIKKGRYIMSVVDFVYFIKYDKDFCDSVALMQLTRERDKV